MKRTIGRCLIALPIVLLELTIMISTGTVGIVACGALDFTVGVIILGFYLLDS
jgi:hypothetical protein